MKLGLNNLLHVCGRCLACAVYAAHINSRYTHYGS